MSENLKVELKGRVLHVVLSNPGKRNALSLTKHEQFAEAMVSAGDKGAGAIVLSGEGGFFCAGGDMDGLEARANGPAENRRSGVDKLNVMVMAMRQTPVPVIAAVEGGAAGAGFSLMLACDMIVAASNAFASSAYVKIGLSPDGGMSEFLLNGLPRHMAMEMLLTGDRIAMEKLSSAGVVNHLVEPGTAVDAAHDLATRIAAGPAGSLASIKVLVNRSAHPDLEGQLEAEAEGIARAYGGLEIKEGVAAFKEKRKPVWPQ
jgi:enoyl-CoA hydratase/carnithine racemase